MKATDRILICKMGENPWTPISNPHNDAWMFACSGKLWNYANDYVEYKNCGVRYRIIRRSDAEHYGLPADCVGIDRDEILAKGE
jgi:hypothetical protein